jgi:[acyl-carrier-protein] S-malonyltransferase
MIGDKLMSEVALLFPGQGSHFVGMGRDIYDEYPVAKAVFEEANDVLGFDIAKICFSGSLLEVNSLENMFPGLYIVCVALLKVYMQEIGVTPKYLAGHSLGEFAALTCSGALDFADALRIIYQRGVLSQTVADAGEGTMTIIEGVDIGKAEAECKKVSSSSQYVAISCYNSPNQIAISGYRDAVMQVEDRLIELGAQISPILTAPPIHSLLMQPVADQLEIELKKCNFHELKWPVIANVDARPYVDPGSIFVKLKLQLTHPVQWLGTIQYLEKQGVTTFIEIGPQAVLASLLKTFMKNITAMSVNNRENRQSIAKILSGK